MTASAPDAPQPADWAEQPEEAYVAENDTEWQDESAPNTFPSGDTADADRRDAGAAHGADAMPTAEEEAAAPTEVDPEVAENYEDALERGANVKGEGQIS
jgi:hypothetical protein